MKYRNDRVLGYDLGSLPEAPVEALETLSLRAATDGIVLLKNDGDVLPFKKGEKIAVFGRIAREYYKSGTGSGGMVNVKYVTNILDALNRRDTVKTDAMLNAYYDAWLKDHPFDKGAGWAQEPWCQPELNLPRETVNAAASRTDVALVVIGRTAGEDKDNSANEGSYLLTHEEEELLRKVSLEFSRVVVVLNVGNVMDMTFVEKYNVSSVLYVWQGGMCGGEAAARVLLGEVSPSGKLSDTIVKNIADYPSMKDFGSDDRLVYTEDIYVGYRYFETFAKDRVLYPFGFGLSYTTFRTDAKLSVTSDRYTVEAAVTNTGDRPGREVVEVYVEAPQGKLGKPARVLVAFAKTKTLDPGKSETLTLTFENKRFASYDDAGKTGHKSAFVLEAGNYGVYAGSDVRTAPKIGSFTLPDTVVEQSEEALSPVTPFDRMINENGSIGYEPAPLRTYDMAERMKERRPDDLPYTGDRGFKLKDVADGKCTMRDFLSQLSNEDFACLVRGEGMNSPKVTPGTGSCFGAVTDSLIGFGIPIACTTDGPSGIRMDCGAKATSLPNGTCLACSFDTDLVHELYELEGVEMTAYKIDIILAPGINIHRTPLNGRNFEYFSEDPLLTGLMAVSVAEGVRVTDTACTVKHFVANNQEHKRHDYDSVVSERAIREIYAKPFEIAVREGKARALMTSYNLINGLHASTCYDLTATLLRGAWGYDGFVMSDWFAKTSGCDGKISKGYLAEMVKAQNDVYMCVVSSKKNEDNLLSSLENGFLSRGEIAVCAENLLNHLLKTHAYERFGANGYTYDIRDVDISSLEKAISFTDVKPGEPCDISALKPGKYVLEIGMSSPMSDLAQIPVDVAVGVREATTIGAHGTNGKTEKFTTILYVSGIRDAGTELIFTSLAEISISSVAMYKL